MEQETFFRQLEIEAFFWNLIPQSNLENSTSSKSKVLTAKLSNDLSGYWLSFFECFVRSKVSKLFNSNFLNLMKLIFHNPTSDDFVNFSCWIIFEGRAFYEKILLDPDNITETLSTKNTDSLFCVDLRSLTDRIYEAQMGIKEEDYEKYIMPSHLGEYIFSYHSLPFEKIKDELIDDTSKLIEQLPRTSDIFKLKEEILNQETFFWDLIQKVDLDNSNRRKHKMLTDELTNLPNTTLVAFEFFVRSKVSKLFNSNFLNLMTLIVDPVASDFADFSFGIILEGRAFYEKMLLAPDNIAEILSNRDVFSLFCMDLRSLTDQIYEAEIGIKEEDYEKYIMPSHLGEYIFSYDSLPMEKVENELINDRSKLVEMFPRTSELLKLKAEM